MSSPKPCILILTARTKGWATQRFRTAAEQRGIPLKTADPSEAMLEIGSVALEMRTGGKKLSMPAVVLPRLGPGNYENGLAVLGHLEAAGVPVCNSREAIETARDSMRTLLRLRAAGLKVPHTLRLVSIRDLEIAQKRVKGPPWILKTFTGAMGIGTMLISKADQLEAIVATLWALKQPVLMQEFLQPAGGAVADVRALVVGRKVLGAIRRRARVGEFRANVHKGATPEALSLTASDKRLALLAASAAGLGIAGVDWIVTRDGPVVLEVNATPGFKGFEAATGIDAAGAMIDYAAKLAGML